MKPRRTGNEVHVIALSRGRLWAGPHYEPSVCAPYTTDLRADFDFTKGERLPERNSLRRIEAALKVRSLCARGEGAFLRIAP